MLSLETQKQIVALHLAGVSNVQIGREVGCSDTSVAAWLRRLGVRRVGAPPRPYAPGATEPLAVGDRVQLLGAGYTGRVLELGGGKARVRIEGRRGLAAPVEWVSLARLSYAPTEGEVLERAAAVRANTPPAIEARRDGAARPPVETPVVSVRDLRACP